MVDVLVALDVVAPHDDGVDVVLVVVLAHPGGHEAETSVQRLGPVARGPHLQRPRRAATPDRHTRERREQLRRHPRTAFVAMHGDVGDVCLAGHAGSGDEHQPAVPDHGAAPPRDDVVAAARADLSQLVVEDVGAPGPWIGVAFDRHHLADVARPHRFEDDRPADGPVEYPFQDAHGRRLLMPRRHSSRRPAWPS